MDGSSPLRGADAVNGEFEVGYDQSFEGRWRIAELVGRVVMVLFVLGALAGLMGRGPLSHRTHRTQDGQFAVDFEPLARYDTGTQVTFHLSSAAMPLAPAAKPAQVNRARLYVSAALLEPMGLQDVLPRPLAMEAVAGGIICTFAIPPGQTSALVRFVLKPMAVGPIEIDAREYVGDGTGAAGDEEDLRWTQVVLP